MPSPFLALRDAIADLLEQSPAVADQVKRNQVVPAVREHLSLANVRLIGTQGTRSAIRQGYVDWSTVLVVDLQVRCAADADPVEAIDALLVPAYTRLAAVGPALGLGVEDVLPDPDIQWDIEEADKPLVSVTLSVRITHRTEGLALVAWP